MNRTIARSLVLPLLSAGILGGAAVGLAGTAAAAEMNPQPGLVAVPQDHAKPAPEAVRAPSGTATTTRCSTRTPPRASRIR